MSGVATAIVGSAVVGAYAASKAAESKEEAINKASSAEERSTIRRINFEREMLEQQREDLAPWRQIGESALRRLESGVRRGEYDPGSFDFDFEADPGYEFRLQEGVNALDASAAARGRLRSGAQDKAIMSYGQDLASQEYGNAFSRAIQEYQMEAGRKSDEFNRLAALSGIGQSATSQTVRAGQNTQQNIGNAITRSGWAQAQNYLRRGQARSSFYGDAAGAVNQGVQNYLLYDYMKN